MKTLFIILAILTFIGGGYLTDQKFNFSNQKTEISTTQPNLIIRPQMNIFIVADGSWSCYGKYKIPRVDTSLLNRLASEIFHSGTGGNIFITHIDGKISDNTVLHLNIPFYQLSRPAPLVKETFEIGYFFIRRKSEWEKLLEKYQNDSIFIINKYITDKREFITDAYSYLINEAYKVKNRRTSTSNVVGAAEVACKTLHALEGKKIILLFSDLENTPDTKSKMNVPDGIKAIAVIPVIGMSKKAITNVVEFPSTDIAIKNIFKNLNP